MPSAGPILSGGSPSTDLGTGWPSFTVQTPGPPMLSCARTLPAAERFGKNTVVPGSMDREWRGEGGGPSNKETKTCAIADEPVQAWLDSLPRDDVQHLALLPYARLSTIFDLNKTDTAATVGEVLHRNERTIRRWVDDFVANNGEFSDSQQDHHVE